MTDDTDLNSLMDYYASQGMSNPQLSYDQNGNPIFQSNKLPVDISNLQDYAATLPPATPNPLPTHETWINPIAKGSLTDALTGLGGGERYQLFPERIVRSALSLPTDVMSGKVQTPVSGGNKVLSSDEDSEDELLQRVQDMAALMGGGGVAMAEKGALGTAGKLAKAVGSEEPLLQNGHTRLYRGESSTNEPNGGYYTTDKEYASNHGNLKYVDLPNQDANFFKMPGMKNIYNLTNYEAGPSKTNWRLKANTLKSDNEAAAPIAALEKAPVFHSAVENAVNAASLKSAPPQQWLSTIVNAKGVKPEELDWTGLKDFLQEQKGPVSKEQIQQHLEGNKVELKEVNKGDSLDKIAKGQALAESHGHNWDDLSPVDQNRYVRKANMGDLSEIPGSTKYQKYQLPGGENYREKLLTLPNKLADINEARAKEIYSSVYQEGGKSWEQLSPYEKANWTNNFSHQDAPPQYKSSHWDEPNVLAHIRMNDRTIGDKKALHIEEIQSDWHQQGREQGYKITDAQKKELENIDNKLTSKLSEGDIGNPDMDAVLKTAVEKKVITSQEAANYKQWSKGENSNIPDAPFKKTWLDLAAKRIIREAAEQGKDVLSWTPGEAQAARYDLSKHINEVHYNKTRNILTAYDHNGKAVISEHSPPEKVPDYIGKEAAKKLFDEGKEKTPEKITELPEGYHLTKDGKEWGVTPPGQIHARPMDGLHPNAEAATNSALNRINEMNKYGQESYRLKDQQLKVGGEGMHYFYDKMLPAVLEKLTGQKMKQSNIDQPGGIGQWSYKGPNRSVDDIIKIARNAPSVSIEHQLGDIANAMKDGNDFGTAVEMHGSYHAAKMLGGELTPVKKPVPINYIDLPQSVKDTALHRGFPLFSSGLMLNPVEDNPFAKSKYKLVPVDHNPFEEKK